ncbi:DHH family protein [uncultured archaeon]|nr:DHH family protein [uncultured archaeon]
MPLKSLAPLFKKRVLLLTHSGCDVDSLGSAAAIHFSLKGKSTTAIGVPEHINTSAKALAQKLEIPYEINPSLDGYDAVVCLDFNELGMLGPLREGFLAFSGEKFLVDHHEEKGVKNGNAGEKETALAPEKNSLVHTKAVSTTEIVYGLLKASKIKPPKKALAAIACGIITDSSSFLIADHETFAIMSEVMRNAAMPYREIASLFRLDPDLSQKVAQLKSARRCRIFRAGDSIVALADVSAFEADAASTLVRIGADVAFCGDADGGRTRVSARANSNWVAKTRFDLTKHVFGKLGEFFPGSGGGHAGAAAFNGKGKDIWPVLLKCAELANEFLCSEKQGELKEYK